MRIFEYLNVKLTHFHSQSHLRLKTKTKTKNKYLWIKILKKNSWFYFINNLYIKKTNIVSKFVYVYEDLT